jgi:hypothetical protein
MWREPELKQVLAYHYLNHMNVRENLKKKNRKKIRGKKREKRVSGRADGALLLRSSSSEVLLVYAALSY